MLKCVVSKVYSSILKTYCLSLLACKPIMLSRLIEFFGDFAAVCCALLRQIFDGADVNLGELDHASDEYLLDETDGI